MFDFTGATSLAAEHRRLMDDHGRAVDFSRSTVGELPRELRAGLAELWRARMVSEHRAIGIFHLFALDLLAAGAPAEVLSGVSRAALDEVRHAELMARLASLYGDAPASPPPGIPPLSEDYAITIDQQAAREALHLCVGSETFSAVLLQARRERATDPVVRDVLGVLLADEIHHARLGWAYLRAWLADDASGARLEFMRGEIVPLFDDLTRAMFGDPRALPAPAIAEPLRPLATAHGWIAAREEYALYRAALDEVWAPGLRALGLPAEQLAARYPELG